VNPDLNPHHFGKLDPYTDPHWHHSGKLSPDLDLDPHPHQSEKQYPDPHPSEKVETLEGHFEALEGPNLEKASVKIRIWIRTHIKLKDRI
jgi:hypothetical protein